MRVDELFYTGITTEIHAALSLILHGNRRRQ